VFKPIQIIPFGEDMPLAQKRKVLSESNGAEYKVTVEKLSPKLNAFISSTKA